MECSSSPINRQETRLDVVVFPPGSSKQYKTAQSTIGDGCWDVTISFGFCLDAEASVDVNKDSAS